MDKIKIDRINELYKKQKSVGLSKEEKEEQETLRKEYVNLFKKNLKSTLNTIQIKDEKGNIRSLKKS